MTLKSAKGRSEPAPPAFWGDHLAILMMERAAGVTFRIVHFEGGAQQFTATLGGQVDVSFDNVGSVVTKIRAGQVRGLAVMDKQRSKFIPDVPTLAEVGFPNIISSSTRGIMGPKAIPDPIVKKIQDIFLTAMKDPDHIEKMEKVGLAVMPMLGAEYTKYFKELHETCKAYMDEPARQGNEKPWGRFMNRPHKNPIRKWAPCSVNFLRIATSNSLGKPPSGGYAVRPPVMSNRKAQLPSASSSKASPATKDFPLPGAEDIRREPFAAE
jgi:hypothetical protein